MILINNIARKGTRMSHLRRISTAALALFLALTPAAAWAGPDQDKEWIVTGQHVDAPIPVWHDDTNSFSLNTINMPMEKTALWIPKAWTGTGEKDEAKSQLVVPAKRPDLAFLGAEGTVLNAAPRIPDPVIRPSGRASARARSATPTNSRARPTRSTSSASTVRVAWKCSSTMVTA